MEKILASNCITFGETLNLPVTDFTNLKNCGHNAGLTDPENKGINQEESRIWAMYFGNIYHFKM